MQECDDDYLRFIRTQPCCICGDDVSVEAHHLRVELVNHSDKPGMQQRSSDRWALPLCGRHHREAHGMNGLEFWLSRGIDPIALAMHYRVRR